MLTREDNELLCRVGPGTPMGELFRRFWLPALVADEIEAPGSPPVRLRILGEDLLAFRDSTGRAGIIEPWCSHRGAPLWFGRNEDGALRCAYHGWAFDVDGRCLEVPNAFGPLEDAGLRARMGVGAYPTREAGGLVWVYMGPAGEQPELPGFEWLDLPASQRHVSRWLQRSNWLQGAEGEIDTSHVSFLHRDSDPRRSAIQATGAHLAGADGAPEITVRETPYGFSSGARRTLGGEYFWRVSRWLLPMYSMIPRAPGTFTGCGGRAWVPIDDNHTTTFGYSYRIDRALGDEELALIHGGEHFPPRTTRMAVQLDGAAPIDTFVPQASVDNDYLIDRDVQGSSNYTGIRGVSAQDRSVQERMRPFGTGDHGIVDRSREKLVKSDVGIVTARRRLLQAVRELQQGRRPEAAARGALYRVRPLSRITTADTLDTLLAQHGEQDVVPAAAP